MSATRSRDSSLPACERYTAMLANSRKSRLPPGFSQPQPPSAWPQENVALLERYLDWLAEDGAGQTCIDAYYLPVAGHALGFNLVPHAQLDLQADLERVMAYAQARQLARHSLVMTGHALNRFRRFLRLERGLVESAVSPEPVDVASYEAGLPAWLVLQLRQYQHLRQANWRPARLKQAIYGFWSKHTRLFQWLFAHYPIDDLSHIRREQLFPYIDEQLAAGYSPKSVNQDVRAFQAVLHFLQERDFQIPRVLLHLPGLKEADALPRFLTDEQVNKLRSDLEQRVERARIATQQRNASLDRAAFYLLWQGGLRLGELEELCLLDLNLGQRQLLVRRGKGLQDRAVYLTGGAIAALTAYLAVRGSGETEHVFLFRHRPLCKDFIRGRIKAAGERVGVKVTPHQLRHTFATQLLNAGCLITTIQALLGHRHLNTTMTYARVHDHKVANDYFAAMAVIEQQMVCPSGITAESQGENGKTHQELLAMVDALGARTIDEDRQSLLEELRRGLLALAG